MPNTNKCWDCGYCERHKIYDGTEVVTAKFGTCQNGNSPFYKGKTDKCQPDSDTIIAECEHFKKPNYEHKQMLELPILPTFQSTQRSRVSDRRIW